MGSRTDITPQNLVCVQLESGDHWRLNDREVYDQSHGSHGKWLALCSSRGLMNLLVEFIAEISSLFDSAVIDRAEMVGAVRVANDDDDDDDGV